MVDPTSDYRQKVWLYREPWRSLFLLLLLALIATHVINALGDHVDSYSHQTLNGILIGSGLVYLHLSAAYIPLRWRGTAINIGLAFALGLLVWTLVD